MKNKIVLTVFLFGLLGCKDLIEVEDISNEKVTVLSPSDGSILDGSETGFHWEPLDFAEGYQLQIASPDFDMAETILEDTLLTTSNFTKALSPGNYQWRIRARNFGYQTLYTTQSLTIED